MSGRRTTDADGRLIVRDYQDGDSIPVIARRYGWSNTTICNCLHRAGVTMRKCGFPGMKPAQAFKIRSMAGTASQATGRGHRYNSETARVHAKKGARIAAEVRRKMKKQIKTKIVTCDFERGEAARPLLHVRQQVTGGPTTSLNRQVVMTITFEEARKITLALQMGEEEQVAQRNARAARARDRQQGGAP